MRGNIHYMSREQHPNSPKKTTTEAVPHSGRHHGERSVREFDNTPLSQAVADGLVDPVPALVPESFQPTEAGHAVTAPAPETSRPERPRTPRRATKIIGGVAAGTALVAGAVLGVKALGGESNEVPAPDPGPTAEAPVVPGNPEPEPTPNEPEVSPTDIPSEPEAEPDDPETELTVEALEIPAGLSAEEVAPIITNRIDTWVMTGADAQARERRIASGLGTEQFQQQEAAKNAEVFAEALFIPGWQNDPTLARVVEYHTELNMTYIRNVLGNIARDEPLFEERSEYVGVREIEVATEDGSRTLEIDFDEVDNYTPEPYRWTMFVTLKVVDGVERISAYNVRTAVG